MQKHDIIYTVIPDKVPMVDSDIYHPKAGFLRPERGKVVIMTLGELDELWHAAMDFEHDGATNPGLRTFLQSKGIIP